MITTIVLADDHQIVRQGLRALLEAESSFKVVGEASDGRETLELVTKLKPDVLILDLMMPGMNGIEVTRHIGKEISQTRVVVLSMYANEAYVLETLANGASAYVLKDSSAVDLVRAVHEVAAGRRYLSPPFTDRAIEAYQEKARAANLDKFEKLTPREREVLQLAAEGHSSGEVALRLGISTRTAETHRTNLMKKLNLHSQAELTRYAIKRGIISLES